ncbi:MAG: cation acetate symporter [Actinomycetota bacterium]
MTATLSATSTENLPAAAVVAVTVLTLVLGSFGLRYARTTSNFFVASRAIHPRWNAFAVCGEAMSAASFLGVPALVLVFGVDMLWALVGWTIGFLLLSLFIAAPLRRFGSYTIPEFVEGRLDAPRLRPIVAALVFVSSWFFLLAQLKGAGVVVRELVGTPYWVGVVAVGVLVAANLSAGGMRGITFVQGFQFFFIFLGILVPFVFIAGTWLGDDGNGLADSEFPTFDETTEVVYERDVMIAVAVDVTVEADARIDGVAVDGPVRLEVGDHDITAGSELVWPAGSRAPHAAGIDPMTGEEWAEPLGSSSIGGGYPLYFSIAILLANMFGIMGLPHIVSRFYTNPTGREARRTNVWVLALIAPYYAMLPLFGAVGRSEAPELLGNGATDSATVVAVDRVFDGIGSDVLTSFVAAGASAAFLSTASGLLIAMAGAVSHDVLKAGVPQFRAAVWVGAAVSIGAGLLVESFDINVLIGWSTSIAASSICPLLVLGVWWPGFTRRGAFAVAVIGGGLSTAAALLSMLRVVETGWPFAVLSLPAVWSVPLAFISGILVSRFDSRPVADLGHKFALMHVPERRDEQTFETPSSITSDEATAR